MVARWIRHLLRLTAAQSLRLCTWWNHSAVPAGKRFIPVYRLAMEATRQGDDVAGWKFGACSGISSRHSIKGSSEPFASSARVFSGFCLSFMRSISVQFVFPNMIFSPLMPINCLINCPINFWTFRAFRVPKQINGFLMNQFMNINVSKRRSFRLLPFPLFVPNS